MSILVDVNACLVCLIKCLMINKGIPDPRGLRVGHLWGKGKGMS
jgi:hypothetical protein